MLHLLIAVLLSVLAGAPVWAGTTVLATDNCTRADNADLGTAWDPNIGTFKIATNVCTGAVDGNDATETNNTVAWPADQYAKATFGVAPTTVSGTGYGVGCRWDAVAHSGYWLVGSTQGYEVVKWTAGATASLQKAGTTTFANANTIEMRCTGSSTTTIQLFKNGSIFSTVTDASSPFTTGRVAITHSSTTSAGSGISAWEGGSVTTTQRGAPVIFP